MARLNAARLADSLDLLDHSERSRRIAQLVRETATTDLEAILKELPSVGDEGAHLALAIARHSKHAEVVTSLLLHPSAFVRGHAARMLHHVAVAPESLVALWPQVSAAQQSAIVQVIRKQRLSAVAAHLIESGLAPGAMAGRLLAACESETVRLLLPRYAPGLSSWSTLCRNHPGVVIDYFAETVRALAPQHRVHWISAWSSAWLPLARTHPSEVLELVSFVEGLQPSALLPAASTLLRLRPVEFGDFLLGASEPGAFVRASGIRRHLRSLDNGPSTEGSSSQLELLARRVARDSEALSQLLRAVAPSRRPEMLEAAFEGVDPASLQVDDRLLEVLPGWSRAAHARRLLAQVAALADSDVALRLSSFLPPADALPVLESAARRSDAQQRAQGLRLLINCIARSRDADAANKLVVYIGRLRNEQDPVRMVAVQALAAVPIVAFTEIHVPMLTALADDVANARDTSWLTRSSLTKLLTSIVAEHSGDPLGTLFQSGLRGLGILSKRDGALALPSLEGRLSDESAFLLIDAFLPQARKRSEIDHEDLVLSIAASVGRRGWGHAGLHEALREIVWRGRRDYTAENAARLWLADSKHRVERTRQLVGHDQSWLYNHVVSNVANHQAQTLLDPLLTGRALSGRFGSRRSVSSLVLMRGSFHRWGPTRRRRYAKLIEGVLATTGPTTAGERSAALRVVAEIAEVGTPLLMKSAERHRNDVLVYESALAQLAGTDRPETSIPLLLSEAGGDRARVAIYALRKASGRSLPGNHANEFVTVMKSDTSKLTSRKEVIRLLGEVLTPEVQRELASLCALGTNELHRDLRIALATTALAAQQVPWLEAAWRGLAEGGPDEQWALTQFDVRRVTPQLRPLLGELLLSVSMSSEERVKRAAFVSMAHVPGLESRVVDRVVSALHDFEMADWQFMVDQLAVLYTQGGLSLSQCSAFAKGLVDRYHDESRIVDLPAKMRLGNLSTALVGSLWRHSANRNGVLRAVALEYASHPLLLRYALQLLAAAIEWSDPASDLAIVVERSSSPIQAVAAGQFAASSLSAAISRHGRGAWNQEVTARWCSAALSSTSVHDRLVAVGVLGASGRTSMWPEVWREMLHRARLDGDADVSRLAHDLPLPLSGPGVGQVKRSEDV